MLGPDYLAFVGTRAEHFQDGGVRWNAAAWVIATNLAIIPVSPDAFTNANGLSWKSAKPPNDPAHPESYEFQTIQGTMGVLQILGTNANPRGVKIRYKLVQNLISQERITESQLLGEWQYDVRRTIMVLDSSHVYRLKADDGRTTFGEWKLEGNRLITIGQAWLNGPTAIKLAVTNDTAIKELSDSRMVLQNWGGPATTLTRVTSPP